MVSGHKFMDFKSALFPLYRKLIGCVYGQNCLLFALLMLYWSEA